MKTKVINQSAPDALDLAVEELRSGHVIAFCTDTVYGIAADAFNPKAIQAIYIAKGRNLLKAIPLMAGNFSQVNQLATRIDQTARLLINKYWPGALTIILPKSEALPKQISHNDTVGIRMPNHNFCLRLLHRFGPLAVTSANRSGWPESRSAEEVFEQLAGKVSLIVDGGSSPGGTPSTIVDLTTSRPKLIREGAIRYQEIIQFLDSADPTIRTISSG